MSATVRTHSEGRASRARLQEPAGLRALEALVIAADLVVIGTGVWVTDLPDMSVLYVLAAWTLLVAFAGLMPVPTQRGVSLGLDLPLVLGAGLAFGPLAAGVVAFVGVLDVRELRREVTLSRALFNRAQVSLSAMAGATVFLAVGGHLGTWPWAAIAGLMALLVDSSVNYLLVGTYWAIKDGQSLPAVLQRMSLGPIDSFLFTYVCFGFLSVFVGEAYLAWGLPGVLACVAPVALARQAFLHRNLLERADLEIERGEEALLLASQRIAEERRDERMLIAGELHDEVLPPLFKVHLMGQVLKQDLATGQLLALDEDLPGLIEATQVAQAATRGMMGNLRRSPLGPGGLRPSLSMYARQLESAGAPPIELDLESFPASEVSELLCYQVAREALNNVLKHAQAARVRVRLRSNGEAIRLMIEDDGVGFNLRTVNRESHYGLQMLLERVEACGGMAAVDSEVGLGTRVVAVIPCEIK
jgi:signal transduction histidine kinase